MIDEKEIEVFLSHHGVKGQRWGIRNLVKQHEINKASRQRVKAKKASDFEKLRKQVRPSGRTQFTNAQRAKDIDRARQRVKSGALRADLKEARAQYKIDKAKKGRAMAKHILKKKREALYNDADRAEQSKNGAEAVVKIFNAYQKSKADQEWNRKYGGGNF